MPPKPWIRPFPPNEHLHFSPLRRTQDVKDSDGNTYRVFVQNEEMSCGLAAASMAIDLYRGQNTADSSAMETRLKHIAGQFPGSLEESDKLWAAGKDFGSLASNIKATLNAQGVKVLLVSGPTGHPIPIDVTRLGKPAIILWGWYPNGRNGNRNGGHFTVAARLAKSGQIVILDPWDGSLSEIAPGARYHGTGYADMVLYTA
ncbi:MAG TPA: papain-like cysteine protease family protein [Rhizobium sp.]